MSWQPAAALIIAALVGSTAACGRDPVAPKLCVVRTDTATLSDGRTVIVQVHGPCPDSLPPSVVPAPRPLVP